VLSKLTLWLYIWSDTAMCHYINILIKSSSNEVFVIRMATSEEVSASHHVFINLQVIKFILMWVLSYFTVI